MFAKKAAACLLGHYGEKVACFYAELEYNTIVNRIKLNEQLNQKLEETAQALYKHWFVDFEFPNENGQPYKSSGGKMIYNEELKIKYLIYYIKYYGTFFILSHNLIIDMTSRT